MSQTVIQVPRQVSKIWKKPKEDMVQIRSGSEDFDLKVKTAT